MLASGAMRRTLRLAALACCVLALTVPAWAQSAGGGPQGYRHLRAIDNLFSPRIVRVPVGGEVSWGNEGRSIHNVVADDGSFESPTLNPGDEYEHEFDEPGAYFFHCAYHGAPGVGMATPIDSSAIRRNVPVKGTSKPNASVTPRINLRTMRLRHCKCSARRFNLKLTRSRT